MTELRRAFREEAASPPPLDWASAAIDELRLPRPPGPPQPELVAAYELAQAGAKEASMEAFAEVLRHAPKSSYAWLGLGASALALGHADRARQAFLQHLKRVPDDAAAWANLAEVELRRGDLAAAERSLERARAASLTPELERRVDALGRGLARRRG